jgi:hypothetical protein
MVVVHSENDGLLGLVQHAAAVVRPHLDVLSRAEVVHTHASHRLVARVHVDRDAAAGLDPHVAAREPAAEALVCSTRKLQHGVVDNAGPVGGDADADAAADRRHAARQRLALRLAECNATDGRAPLRQQHRQHVALLQQARLWVPGHRHVLVRECDLHSAVT